MKSKRFWLFMRFTLVLLLLSLFVLPHREKLPPSERVRFFAISDGTKIRQDETPPAPVRDPVWNGRGVQLHGARNEIVSFQLNAWGGKRGVRRLSVALRGLKHGPSEYLLRYAPPSSDPSRYIRRPIRLFGVHYMQVSEPTTAPWRFRPNSAPQGWTGLQPVQLIPENAKRKQGGFPLSVDSYHNQAVWFDIYIPPDAPSGRYQGEIVVTFDGTRKRIPLRLNVHNFTLPDRNAVQALVYYEPYQVEMRHGANLDDRYHRFAHAHHIELTNSYSMEEAEKAAGRFTGSDFTAKNGYAGPGNGQGNLFIPASFYWPGKDFNTPELAAQSAPIWMRFLKDKFPFARTFLYMPDEPGSSQYAYIQSLSKSVKESETPGNLLPIFVTSGYKAALDGYIDIWAADSSMFKAQDIPKVRARGAEYWVYNGSRPATGVILIDAPATDSRVIPWSLMKHGVTTYFYWHGVHWQHNAQKVGERNQNVWSNPITFDNRGQPGKSLSGQGFGNGEGVLIYPGEDRIYPDGDRGIIGPIGTVQLANLRRGLQDAVYLKMAAELGLSDVVQRAYEKIVPAVLSEASGSIGFTESVVPFEEARAELAMEIERAVRRHP